MDLTTVARQLREAERTGQPCAPLREHLVDGDAAYAVQRLNTQRRLAAGERVIGRKIGLTNKTVQAQLGVDEPDYGALFASMDRPHDDVLVWNPGEQLRVEAEIAFVLSRDLPHVDTSMGELMQAIDFVVPSLEIVGSRIRDWDIRFVDTVADNASSAYFTLGPAPRRLDAVDLIGCRMHLQCDDETVSEGSGAACLGSPLNAVLWLARRMALAGQPLAAGEVVLSGALGPMVPARPNSRFVAEIEGFGQTAIQFGEQQ